MNWLPEPTLGAGVTLQIWGPKYFEACLRDEMMFIGVKNLYELPQMEFE